MHISRAICCCAIALAALPLWAASGRGQARIEIEGNRLFTNQEVHAVLGGNREPPLQDAVKRLQNVYYERGYVFATVHVSAGGDGSGMLIAIDEGEQAKYGTVSVSGAPAPGDERVRRELGIETGSPFDPGLLGRGMERLLRFYDESGYPFVQIWIDSLRLNERKGTVDVALIVADGGRKELGAVVFEGLTRTREDVAAKLSGLKVGEAYSGERMRDAVGRLRALNVFRSVGQPRISISPGGGGVEARIAVKEPARANTAAAAAGYADREDGSPRAFSGMARLDFLNIGGSLKDLSVFWQNDGAGRNETKIAFRNRLFLGHALGVGVSLEQTAMDTLYTWQSAGADCSIPLGSAGGRITSVLLSLNADRNVFGAGAVKRSWRFRLSSGLSTLWGSEERGSLFSIDARLAVASKKQYPRSEDPVAYVTQYIASGAVRAGMAFGMARVHTENSYRGIESSEASIPSSEQFYLGGAGTLRGYRENQFHGTRTALSRNELRFGSSAEENAYAFIDIGYVMEEQSGEAGGKRGLLRAGYGFGLRTESKVGNVDLSFGVGERLSLRQTKVHVILGHRF